MKIYWAVRVDRKTCTMEHFIEAWADFKSHDFGTAIIFPRILNKRIFEKLGEFDGW